MPPVFVDRVRWHIAGRMMPEPPRRQFPLLSTIGLYALGFAVLAWPWLSGRVTIPWDAKSYSFPVLSHLARSLASDQSPFWTPNIYAGWPLIADPQSLIFSPLHVALAFFNPSPSFQAADAVVFALLFIGGLGVILIFRERGWHEGGALVAAFAFAFGGSNASRIQNIGMVESVCWLALALFLLMRALRRSSWWWGGAAGLVAGLVAIGRDQVGLLSLYVLAGFVLWHWIEGGGVRARIRASFTPLAAGALVGGAVIVVPFLLTALLAASSNRPEIGYEIAIRGSLHPADLLMLVFADFYGAADPGVPYWGPPSFPWHETFGTTDLYHAQNIGQLYAGALAVVALLGFGIVRGHLWSRDIRFFSVALVLMLLYALGKYTPAFRAMYELMPGASLYRRPADATFPFGFLLAVCAGYLVHRWLMAAVPESKGWHRGADAVLAMAVFGAAVFFAIKIGTTAQAVSPLIIGILTLLAAVGVLRLAYRLAATNALAAAALLAAFSVADLSWNNSPNESTGLPPSFYDALRPGTQNDTIALLRDKLGVDPGARHRVELIGIGYHWPNIGMIHGFDHLFGHNPLRLAAFARATDVADTVAVPDQRPFSRLLPRYNSPLESLFGVRVIATGVPVEQIDPSLKPGDLTPIGRTKDAYVYENPRALPRAMLVGEWRLADFDEIMRSEAWPDADPRRTVLLERAPRPAFPPSTRSGNVRIISYGNADIVIEVDTPDSAMLVLNDIWHPWWRATLDGAPIDIMKANVLFRGIPVPAGKHTVRFTFHPFRGAIVELAEMLRSRSR